MWLLRISLARPQTIHRDKRRSIYRSRILVLMMNPFASNTIHAHLLSIRPPARDSRGPLNVQTNVGQIIRGQEIPSDAQFVNSAPVLRPTTIFCFWSLVRVTDYLTKWIACANSCARRFSTAGLILKRVSKAGCSSMTACGHPCLPGCPAVLCGAIQ